MQEYLYSFVTKASGNTVADAAHKTPADIISDMIQREISAAAL
jgi:hypothetical protein